jgi:hypothetical protein
MIYAYFSFPHKFIILFDNKKIWKWNSNIKLNSENKILNKGAAKLGEDLSKLVKLTNFNLNLR